jgi:hypothetical protein
VAVAALAQRRHVMMRYDAEKALRSLAPRSAASHSGPRSEWHVRARPESDDQPEVPDG